MPGADGRIYSRYKDGYGMTHWEIIDDLGTIESGEEEEVKEAWEKMLNGTYDIGTNKPLQGDVKLVEVHGVI